MLKKRLVLAQTLAYSLVVSSQVFSQEENNGAFGQLAERNRSFHPHRTVPHPHKPVERPHINKQIKRSNVPKNVTHKPTKNRQHMTPAIHHNQSSLPHKLNEKKAIKNNSHTTSTHPVTKIIPSQHLNPTTKIIPNNHLNPVTKNNLGHHSNPVTKNNLKHATQWNQQFTHNPNNAHWTHKINGYQHQYKNAFYPAFAARNPIYHNFWQSGYYRDWYKPWYKWGFYGGFWYPVNSVANIENYFFYPSVQWFYMDETLSPDYYNSYYSSPESSQANICLGAFPYKHRYFPTDTLRDLLIEVSAFPSNLRCNFRTAIIKVTQELQQKVTQNFSTQFSFSNNDIVVNYSQNLQNKAIVMVGFVNHQKINMAFEVLLDLVNPSESMTFAPKGQKPTQEELQVLNQLNSRIKDLGGNPFIAQQQPKSNDTNAGP